MTKQEIDKRIDEAAKEYANSYVLVDTNDTYACNEVHAAGSLVDTWNDNASCDYPEDLIWSRMISDCYMKAGKHGFSIGARFGIELERERSRRLVEALKHVRRELNNEQVLEPGGPNHDLIETAIAEYEAGDKTT